MRTSLRFSPPLWVLTLCVAAAFGCSDDNASGTEDAADVTVRPPDDDMRDSGRTFADAAIPTADAESDTPDTGTAPMNDTGPGQADTMPVPPTPDAAIDPPDVARPVPDAAPVEPCAPGCPADRICDPATDQCVECLADGDCGDGRACVAQICVNANGECDDDEREDNDGADTAAPIGAGATDDLVICAQDDDWYAINLCPGGSLTVDILFTHADGDLDAALVDANGVQIVQSDSANDNERLQHFSAAGETVSLRVFGFQAATNDYALAVAVEGCGAGCEDDGDCAPGEQCVDGQCGRVPGGDCAADALEGNNDPEHAALLAAGAVDELTICAGDEDWFAVDVCAAGALTASINFAHANGDLDLELRDAAGDVLGASRGVADGESANAVPDADAVVFVRVYGYGEAINDYDLDLFVDGCGAAPACVNDGDEPNDDPATATSIAAPTSLSDRTICAADADFYEVRVCAGGTLRAVADFVHANGNLDLAVFADADEAVATSLSADDGESIEFENGDVEAVYRIAVSGASDEVTSTYDLRVQVDGCRCEDDADCPQASSCVDGVCTPPPGCVDDLAEPNDARDAASALARGVTGELAVCEGNDDWYLIDICAGGFLQVDLRFAHDEGDIDAWLVAPDGAVLSEATSGNDNETILLSPSADETVYLRVYGFNGASNTYETDVVIEGCEPQFCNDDAREDNDAIEFATPAPSGFADDTLQVCAGDVDWFAIDTCAGGVVTVDVTFEHQRGDVDARMLDAAGVEVASGTSATNDERLRFESDAEQTLTVAVEGWSGAENAYGFAVEVTGCGCVADRDCGDGLVCVEGACVPGALCDDDDLEDNDSSDTAAPLGAGNVAARQVCADDDVWYVVDVCPGGNLAIDIAFTDAAGDIDVELFDAAGGSLARSTSGTDNERVEWSADAGGQAFLRVYGFGGAVNGYDLAVAIEGCVEPVCVDDGFEIDGGNGTLDSAASIEPGAFDALTICRPGGEDADEDWFAIAVCAGGVFTADIDFAHADGDIDLEVYADAAEPLARSTSADDDEAIRVELADATTLYVRVYGFSGAQNDYAMAIAVDGCGCEVDRDCPDGQLCLDGACVPPPACLDDRMEENDDAGEAADLVLGAPADRLQICAGDDDWYAFAVCPGGTLTVDVDFTHADGDLDLTLLDAAGVELARSASILDGETVSATPEAGGRLFARVFGFDRAENAYAIAATIVGCPDCIDDGLEPNDDRETATELAAGATDDLRVCADDEDWYTVSLCAGGTATFEVRFTHAAGDLDALLFDADGAILDGATTVSDNESLRFEAGDTAVELWLRVAGYLGAENDYDLDVAIEGCGCVDDSECPGGLVCIDNACVGAPVCPADVFEPNNGAQTARPIAPGVYDELRLCEDDSDWYAIAICAGGTVRIDAAFSHEAGDVDMFLEDSDGLRLGTSDSPDDGESIEWTAVDATLARLSVYGFEGATNGYDLSIEVADCDVPVCVDDDFEPDNTPADSTSLPLGRTPDRQICAADLDSYVVALCAGGTLDVSAEFLHALGDLDVYLVNAGDEVIASGISTDDNEAIRYTAAADETVWLLVVGYEGAANAYALEAAITGCE